MNFNQYANSQDGINETENGGKKNKLNTLEQSINQYLRRARKRKLNKNYNENNTNNLYMIQLQLLLINKKTKFQK